MTDVARVASSRRHRIFDQSSSTRVQHPNKGYLGEGCTGSKDGKAHGRSTLQVMRSVASTTGRLTSSYLPRCHLSRFTSLAAPKYSCPLFLTCCQLLVLDGFLFGEVFSHISVALFGVFCLFSMRWSNTFRLRLIITFPPSSRIEVRSSSCPLPCFASAVRPFASHTKTAHARSASFTTSDDIQCILHRYGAQLVAVDAALIIYRRAPPSPPTGKYARTHPHTHTHTCVIHAL
mmetsp:Transcript_13436/g.23823  ORF Transcript_13436/g.23823 Transcript_13436/m.23823 type:complete len:233 (-) Transcript_13436:903-1601(-)